MARANLIKLKTLKQTQAFYNWELKKGGLTKKERASYLIALKSIKKIIKEKEDSRERGKHKKFIPYDHKKQYSRIIGEVTKKYNPGNPAGLKEQNRVAEIPALRFFLVFLPKGRVAV